MKTFLGLLASSATFGFVICLIYWFVSHDRAGTFLLGFMGMALTWAAGYALVAERQANLPGDDPQVRHEERAGEAVSLVTKQSAWPICLAFSILCLLLGVIWSDFLIVAGLAAMLLCFWRLAAESARLGTERVISKEGREEEFT